ncbi:hypothetical protein [Caballeronia sp. AZ10_KS36]|nr:hypothetical protein [Caballeronia sp. AZ10_KS36]
MHRTAGVRARAYTITLETEQIFLNDVNADDYERLARTECGTQLAYVTT